MSDETMVPVSVSMDPELLEDLHEELEYEGNRSEYIRNAVEMRLLIDDAEPTEPTSE
jgi:metal-responsive CopG/Arc/MetJ family transcriptional regulator